MCDKPTTVIEKTISYKNGTSTAKIEFYDNFFTDNDYYLKELSKIDWDLMYEMGSYGNPIQRNSRYMKWFSDNSNYTYAFSHNSLGGITISNNEFTCGGLKANPLIPILKEIKDKIINLLKCHGIDAKFNSVLVNYYRDQSDSVNWHSDDDPWLGQNFIVPSVTFGSERIFALKAKLDKKGSNEMEWILKNGSLLLMKGMTQKGWDHSIPKVTKVKLKPRINLTFRNVIPSLINKQPKGKNWQSFLSDKDKKYKNINKDLDSRLLLKEYDLVTPRIVYPLLLLLHRAFKNNSLNFELHKELIKAIKSDKKSDEDFKLLEKIIQCLHT